MKKTRILLFIIFSSCSQICSVLPKGFPGQQAYGIYSMRDRKKEDILLLDK